MSRNGSGPGTGNARAAQKNTSVDGLPSQSTESDTDPLQAYSTRWDAEQELLDRAYYYLPQMVGHLSELLLLTVDASNRKPLDMERLYRASRTFDDVATLWKMTREPPAP